MKKRIVTSILLMILTFMFGLSSRILATNQNIANEDIPTTSEAINTPTEPTKISNSINWSGTNSTQNELVNNIQQQLQNVASVKQPKDMKRQLMVVTIIIITVLLIVGLVTWYYISNS